MRQDCTGRHLCDHPFWPTGMGETWTCPECGQSFVSFHVTLTASGLSKRPDLFARTVPAGTYGWRGVRP